MTENKSSLVSNNASCHLQDIGMGSLICRAAKQTGENTTNEVNKEICIECPVGKIYREIGCDAAVPKIRIFQTAPSNSFNVKSILCKIRRENTNYEVCKTCNLPVAETTKQLVTTARSLFEKHGFYSAYKDIEKARTDIRDGKFDSAVTHSIDCLESTMRICHEELGVPLPDKKQVSDLWKSTREILKYNEIDPSESTVRLLNSLSGLITNYGGFRNVLGDAHGKGKFPPDVSELLAELAVNVASTLSTMIVRRFKQVKKVKE